MCRLFAALADRPVSAEPALMTAPHALVRQSCRDLRGQCHPSGWGVGYFVDGSLVRVRSTRPASDDPQYVEAVRGAVSPVVVGHVRQASVGGVSEANTHPFVQGRWLFAHNGTVQGFAENPAPLRDLIPPPWREFIRGATDSEHLFYALLARAESSPRPMADAVGDVLRRIADLYPGTSEEPTRLNVVLTDGDLMAVSRWGHTLYQMELPAPGVVTPAEEVRGIAFASEPVTPTGWDEVPDRSVIVVGRGARPLVVGVG